MGSHNNSSIQDYVQNDTSIKTAISNSITQQAVQGNANYQQNTTNISVGVPANCCKGLTGTAQTDCVNLLGSAAAVKSTMLSCGNKGLVIEQTGNVKIAQSSSDVTETTTQLQQQLSQAVSTQVSDIVKQNNDTGILSDIFGENNSSSVAVKISNSINSDLSVKLSTTQVSSIRNNSGQNDTTNINLCFGVITGSQCLINQDFSFNLYQINTLGATANIIAENANAIKLWNSVSNKTQQTNTNWLSQFIADLGTAEKIIIIAIIAFVIIGIVIALVIMIRESSKHKTVHHPATTTHPAHTTMKKYPSYDTENPNHAGIYHKDTSTLHSRPVHNSAAIAAGKYPVPRQYKTFSS